MFKKKIIAVLMALATVTLSACTSPVNNEEQGVQEVTVLLRGGANTQTTKASIEKFNKENDGSIKIKYEEKDDSLGEYIRVALQAGTAPDIFQDVPESSYLMGINSGWFRTLDEELINKYTELLVPGAVKKDVDGKVRSVAESNGGTFKLIWNKDMFAECGLNPEKPPVTWDEVKEYARILTEKGNGTKYGFALPLKHEGFARLYVMMPGGPSNLYNDDGYDPATGKFDFSIYEPMLNVYKDMVDEGSVFPTPITLDNDTARAQFAEGNIGIMFAARWDVGVFSEQFPCKIDWGIANFPTFTGEFTGSYPVAQSSGAILMNAKSKHPDAQLKVWEFLVGEEFARAQQEAGMRISAHKSLSKPEFMNSSIKGFVELNTVDEGLPLHYIDCPPVPPVQIMGDNYDRAMVSMIMGQIDIKEGLKDLDERYNKGIEEWFAKGNDINEYIVPDYNPNTYVPE